LNQDILEGRDPVLAGRGKINSRPGIQRDQIHFAAQSSHQTSHFARVLHLVIHAIEKHIFKSNALATSQREFARGCHQRFQAPLPVDRHQTGTGVVVRCIQRNGKFGANGLESKVADPRHDSGG